jgi:hypothetical protein
MSILLVTSLLLMVPGGVAAHNVPVAPAVAVDSAVAILVLP